MTEFIQHELGDLVQLIKKGDHEQLACHAGWKSCYPPEAYLWGAGGLHRMCCGKAAMWAGAFASPALDLPSWCLQYLSCWESVQVTTRLPHSSTPGPAPPSHCPSAQTLSLACHHTASATINDDKAKIRKNKSFLIKIKKITGKNIHINGCQLTSCSTSSLKQCWITSSIIPIMAPSMLLFLQWL